MTAQLIHDLRTAARPVDNSPRYTRADDAQSCPDGYDRCQVAIRTRRLPHLLERRRRGHRVFRARLLPAGDRPVRRADDAQAVTGSEEEPQAAPPAAALSGDPREAVLRA